MITGSDRICNNKMYSEIPIYSGMCFSSLMCIPCNDDDNNNNNNNKVDLIKRPITRSHSGSAVQRDPMLAKRLRIGNRSITVQWICMFSMK